MSAAWVWLKAAQIIAKLNIGYLPNPLDKDNNNNSYFRMLRDWMK